MADMLLKAGSDPDCLNKDGQKPIDAAKVNKETLLVELLESSVLQSGSSTPAEGNGKVDGPSHNANGSTGQSAVDGIEGPILSKPS